MEYRADYLSCRSDGHAWEVKELRIVGRSILERHLWCAKHGGWRIDQVDRTNGEVTKRKYVTPKDYHLLGQGRHPASQFRKVLVDIEWKEASIG